MKYTLWTIALVFLAACRSHTASLSNYKQETAGEIESLSIQERENLTQRTVDGQAVVKEEQELDWDTFIITYDTSLPADSLSGLPPVKEIIQQTKRAKIKQTGEFQNQEYAERKEADTAFSTESNRLWQRSQELEKNEKAGYPLHIYLLAIAAVSFCMLLFWGRK